MNITERKIQQKIYDKYEQQSMLIIPNFWPAHWWECDIFRVLKSGYTWEYEIKLSKRDFKADFKKQMIIMGQYSYKHDLLKNKKHIIPNRFSFVFGSEKILNEVDVPDHAGIIFLKEVNSPTRSGKRIPTLALRKIRNAPLLHKKKVDNRIIEQITISFYNRFWKEREKVDYLKKGKQYGTY